MTALATATYTIPRFPLLDQLNQPTRDGMPDEDRLTNCVATSVAAIATCLTSQTYYSDELHDAVYGQGYIGGQWPDNYIGWLRAHGIALSPYRSRFAAGNLAACQRDLVATVRAQVALGRPVIISMPPQWGIAPAAMQPPRDPRTWSGWSHMGVAYGLGPDVIRVMNPWHGFAQDLPDARWAELFLYGEVWIAQAQQQIGAHAVTVDVSGLGAGFAAVAQQHQLECVSRESANGQGEHVYAQSGGQYQSFAAFAPNAAFPDGVILRYDSATRAVTLTHGPDVVMGLWTALSAQKSATDAARAQAAQAAQAAQQLASAQEQLAATQAALAVARGQVDSAQRDLAADALEITQLKSQLAQAGLSPADAELLAQARQLHTMNVLTALALAFDRLREPAPVPAPAPVPHT